VGPEAKFVPETNREPDARKSQHGTSLTVRPMLAFRFPGGGAPEIRAGTIYRDNPGAVTKSAIFPKSGGRSYGSRAPDASIWYTAKGLVAGPRRTSPVVTSNWLP
jgi:hypothetical protein